MKSLLLFLFIFIFNYSHAQTWQSISDFPSSERDDGTSFVIGNLAYCGTGLTPWFSTQGDFYSLDMNTDVWNSVAALPIGAERQYATGFASTTNGFILGGVNGTTYLNDLWMYDPNLNSWQLKTSLPSLGRNGCCSFIINNIAYIVGGRTFGTNAINEVWAYDILNDSWSQKGNMPFGARWRASSTTTQNNKGYLLFGRDANNRFCNELYEYEPSTDTWTQISAFPGIGRNYAALKSMGGDLITLAGLDTFGNSSNDMWRYNTTTTNWQQLDSLPVSGIRGGMCFNNSSTIYYTTGIDQTNIRMKETWKCDNPTIIVETIKGNFKIYPNPINEYINIDLNKLSIEKKTTAILTNNLGNLILEVNIFQKVTKINLSSLLKGVYFLTLKEQEGTSTIKLIK